MKILAICLALVSAAISCFDLSVRLRHIELINIAEILERGGSLSPDVSPQKVQELLSEERDYTCVDAVRLASISLTYVLLNRSWTPEYIADVDRRMATHLREVRRRLNCSPMDGNAWLLLAGAALQAGEPAETVTRSLQLSYRFARNEGWLLSRRIRIAATLSASGNNAFNGDLQRDVESFVRDMPTADVAALFAFSKAARSRILERMTEQSAPRRWGFKRVLDDIGFDTSSLPAQFSRATLTVEERLNTRPSERRR